MRSILPAGVAALSLILFSTSAGAQAAAKPDAAAQPAAAGAAAPAGDAAAGAKVFIKCKACHAAEKGVNKIGPSLHAVLGRKAGTLEGYPGYSDSMKSSGIVWSPETIGEFLKNPRTYIKNTKMLFIGLRNDKEIADLLAYLASLK